MALAWAIAGVIGLGAMLLRSVVPGAVLPGASVIALLAGVLLANLPGRRAGLLCRGAGDIVRFGLPPAIVLLGAGLDFRILADPRVGLGGLLITLVAIGSGFGVSLLAARLFGLSRGTGWLLGAGTAICGNSAILAAAPSLEADEDEIALAVGTVNLLGVVLLFGLPPLAAGLGLSPVEAGTLAGSTVHAVPQAVATGDSIGPLAASFASLFKMVRVSLLAPFVLLLSLAARAPGGARGRADEPGQEKPRRRLPGVPSFLIAFLLLATARTFGWLGAPLPALPTFPGFEAADLAGLLGAGARILLAIVMVGVGMQIEVGRFRRIGPRALAAGALASASMIAVTIAMILRWGSAAG